jgi:hypothetical protein
MAMMTSIGDQPLATRHRVIKNQNLFIKAVAKFYPDRAAELWLVIHGCGLSGRPCSRAG